MDGGVRGFNLWTSVPWDRARGLGDAPAGFRGGGSTPLLEGQPNPSRVGAPGTLG